MLENVQEFWKKCWRMCSFLVRINRYFGRNVGDYAGILEEMLENEQMFLGEKCAFFTPIYAFLITKYAFSAKKLK